MWIVFETKAATKQIARLPDEIVDQYKYWHLVARTSGPQGLRQHPGFRDEALKGKWKGFRSSRLTGSFRVIYEFENTTLAFCVGVVGLHPY